MTQEKISFLTPPYHREPLSSLLNTTIFIRRQIAQICHLLIILAWSITGIDTSAADTGSVFLEELTWTEVRGHIAAGVTTIIIPTGGTEQNGPHMALGKHNTITRYAAGEIAQRLGNTLVAPVVAYVPEGEVASQGHMAFAGTITLPDEFFMKLIEYAVRSLKLHGFENIVLIGDSGGNLPGLHAVQEILNAEWTDENARVYFIDKFTRGDRFFSWLVEQGESSADIGTHAGIMDTSVMLAVDPSMVRLDKLAPGGNFTETGVVGDPTRASVAYGNMGLEIQISEAVAQIRQSIVTD